VDDEGWRAGKPEWIRAVASDEVRSAPSP
jgi:hypothetical protein